MLPGMGPGFGRCRRRYLVASDGRRPPGASPCADRTQSPGQPLAGELEAHPRAAFWIILGDPGAFIMERRMLKGIQAR